MTDRYDVIVIGTGAGGGTLAHTLAPSGKKILLLERGDFLPRELANWDSTATCSSTASTSRRTPGTTSDGNPFQPAGALLRRRRDEDVRRGAVPAAARRLRRDQVLRRDLARPGR